MKRLHVIPAMLACAILSSVSAAGAADAQFWTATGLNALSPSDSFAAGATLNADQYISGQLAISSGTLTGAAVSINPGGQPIGGAGGGPNPYFRWAGGVGTWRPPGPMTSSSEQLRAQFHPVPVTVTFTPTIGVSRSISSTLFTTDTATRTMTVTVTVPAGALASYNSMWLNLVDEWYLPDGLSVTGVSNMTNNAGFSAGSTGNFFNGSVNPASLSGTYTFSADVTFQRSGPLSQASYGNMYANPGAWLGYALSAWSQQTGASVTRTIGANTFTASAQGSTTWDCSVNANQAGIAFSGVVAQQNGALTVSEIDLVKMKVPASNGNPTYQFDCTVEGSNIVSGTLKTPNNQVYDLWIEDTAEFSLYLATEADLQAKDLVNGTYTITLKDAQGNSTVKTIALSGTYPNQDPTLNPQVLDTGNRRPTLCWSPPNTSIDGVYVEVQNEAGYDEFRLLVKGVDDLQTQTSWTPLADMGLGGYETQVGFFNGQITSADGTQYITGYGSSAYAYLNVRLTGDADGDGSVDFADYGLLEANFGMTEGGGWAQGDFDGDGDVDFADYQALESNFGTSVPEPAALSLLALGGLALMRRRK